MACAKPEEDERGCWRYWTPSTPGLIEFGTLCGSRVALPTHFHAENQLTFVLSGTRHFVVRGQNIEVSAGRGIMIEAGVPHCSLSVPGGVECVNAYVPAGEYAVPPMMREIAQLWRGTGRLHEADLAKIVQSHLLLPRAHPVAAGDMVRQTVALAAARAGQSREGFTRAFARERGMPPRAYWSMQRLNLARASLRGGAAIASVAADMGFADQSHFGQAFRKAFGVTPGQFRAAMARSQIS